MRSGLGARRLLDYNHLKIHLASLVALSFPPEYDVMCYYLIFYVPNFLIALID